MVSRFSTSSSHDKSRELPLLLPSYLSSVSIFVNYTLSVPLANVSLSDHF
jgi:hypothetical protein